MDKAPIPTKQNVIDLLRGALANHTMFEYRINAGQKKPLAVDIQSVNIILRIYDALHPKNQIKFAAFAPDVGAMAMKAWELAGKAAA